ncbi:TRCF domain-containing protein [Bdellovibrionota bacterium]
METIASVASMLQDLVPEVKIGIAHGQLPERALEQVMTKFLNREIDLLVCTAIIESGLDIPTANTLVVNRADTFGLAQLYQLRGRVGRAKEQAFAYFLVPSDQTITLDAQKRLEVLQRYTEFGAGFRIASHDLEIRGGGNILGSEQSGHIAAVGFELYTKLLDDAVRELKGESIEKQIEPEITIQIPAFIPEKYIPDTQQRLAMYKRLAMARTDENLETYRQEIRERFGELPKEVNELIRIMALKHRLQKLRVRSLTASSDNIVLEFDPSTSLSHQHIVALVTESPRRYKIKPGDRLFINMPKPTIENTLEEIECLLKTIK